MASPAPTCRIDQPFAEPWQARLFAAAVLACERLGRPWDDFRDQLKAAIAEHPERPYFESFTLALERLLDVAVRRDRCEAGSGAGASADGRATAGAPAPAVAQGRPARSADGGGRAPPQPP